MLKRWILGLGMLSLGASMGWATLVIDDFSTLDPGQNGTVQAPDSCSGPDSPQTYTGTNAIGARQVSVASNGGDGCATMSVATPSPFGRLSLDGGLVPQSATAMIRWDPANQISFTQDLLNTSVLQFLYRVDTGTEINGAQNQSSVIFEFCLEPGGGPQVCMSRRIDFLGQIFPAQLFTWDFAGFTGYNDFWQGLVNGSLVDYVQLTLIGQNDQDLVIDQIQATTPEPSAFLLLGSGLVGLAFLRRRRRT